jgi:hypothetical protein
MAISSWTRKLGLEFQDERYDYRTGRYVKKGDPHPALKVRISATNFKNRARYHYDPSYADEGTFEVKGVEVKAATEREALIVAQSVVRRRLSVEMCTPPRLEFT